MENKTPIISRKREQFNKQYKDLSESEIQIEMLFAQRLINVKLEKIRKNTEYLVVFLIVIPIVLGILLRNFI
jgi:hypothetical protein